MRKATNLNKKHGQDSLGANTEPLESHSSMGLNVMKDGNIFLHKSIQKEAETLLFNESYHSASSDNSIYYKNYLDNLRKEKKYHSNKHSITKLKDKKTEMLLRINTKDRFGPPHVGSNIHESGVSSFKQELSSMEPKGQEPCLTNQTNGSSGNILKKRSNMKGKTPTPCFKNEKRLKIKEDLPPISRNSIFSPQPQSRNNKLPSMKNKLTGKRFSHYEISKHDVVNSHNGSINQFTPGRSNKNKRSNSTQKINKKYVLNKYEEDQRPKQIGEKSNNNNELIKQGNDSLKENKLVLYKENSELLNKGYDASNKENDKNNNAIQQEKITTLKHEKVQPSITISKPKRHFFFCCIPIK